jgi:hypothetical protein
MAISDSHPRWPLPRILVLVLAGMYGGLVLDIRVEHVEAVRDHRIAWVPIIYSAATAVVCLVAFVLWKKSMRRVVLPIFLLSMVVGGTGAYLHSHGKPKKLFLVTTQAWTDPTMDHPDGPPLSAPLAFVGLGAIGVLACLERFSS